MTAFEITQPEVNDTIRAHLAESGDAAAIMALFKRTAEWLQAKGSTQWAELLNGIDKHNTAAAVTRGEVILFREGDRPAAVVILMPNPSDWDRKLWGDSAGDANAVYLHRLSVHRDFAGRGLGRQIMDWIGSELRFAPDKQCVRLDCIASNPTLNAFYREAGYAHIGERDGFCLYERAL